jgi:hypothetical protein
MRKQRRSRLVKLWLSLAVVSAVVLACLTGTAAAREISLREVASLRITKRAGANLEARGKVTGTLAGSLSLRIVVNSAAQMSASFSGSSRSGTLSGVGHSSYVVSGNTLTYAGSGSISGGSGAYAHASGSGIRIEGKMNRQQGTVSMTISGRIRL